MLYLHFVYQCYSIRLQAFALIRELIKGWVTKQLVVYTAYVSHLVGFRGAAPLLSIAWTSARSNTTPVSPIEAALKSRRRGHRDALGGGGGSNIASETAAISLSYPY